MTAKPEHWRYKPQVLSIREAIGRTYQERPAKFDQANWKVHVRHRDSDGYVELANIDDWYIENPAFGKLFSAVFSTFTDDRTDQPLIVHDQYCIEEGPRDERHPDRRKTGIIIVPWTSQQDPATGRPTIYIALVARLRNSVRSRETGVIGSSVLIELPRGFANVGDSDPLFSAIRELREEIGVRLGTDSVPTRTTKNLGATHSTSLGYKVEDVSLLGYTIANSAFYCDDIAVVSCKLKSIEDHEFERESDEDEQEPFLPIVSVLRGEVSNLEQLPRYWGNRNNGFFFPVSDIMEIQRAGYIIDGLSQAALFMFLAGGGA